MEKRILYVLEYVDTPGKYLKSFEVSSSKTGRTWKIMCPTEDLWEAIRFQDKQELINIRRATGLDLNIKSVIGTYYDDDL